MARKITWYYRRNSCNTCAKSDAFLEERGLKPSEVVDARKETLGKRETVILLRGTQRLVAMKGNTVHDWNLKKDPPIEKDLFGSIMGPTGNLRAPALKMGKTLLVGFHQDTWKSVLG